MIVSDNNVSNDNLIPAAEKYTPNQNLGRRREDHSIQIALLDDRCLMLHSISQLLGKYGPEFRIRLFPSDGELLEHHIARDNIQNVVIFSMSWNKQNHEITCRRIQELITKIKDTPLMILSDQEDIECIYWAYQMGVSGYITTNHDPTIVREAVRLVQAGGIFIPSNLAVMIRRTHRLPASKERDEGTTAINEKTIKNFTPREVEVIHALCEGKPNKVIAYELNMQECTVKVHVRNIMKKLNTTNRTQTALVVNQLIYT